MQLHITYFYACFAIIRHSTWHLNIQEKQSQDSEKRFESGRLHVFKIGRNVGMLRGLNGNDGCNGYSLGLYTEFLLLFALLHTPYSGRVKVICHIFPFHIPQCSETWNSYFQMPIWFILFYQIIHKDMWHLSRFSVELFNEFHFLWKFHK